MLVYGHGEPGNLSRLFGEQTAGAPLSNEAQQARLLKRIDALLQRIGELEAQVKAQEAAQPPLKAISQSEARP